MSLFGVNTSYEESSLIIIPVPWEVTTSYGSGASKGPEAILKASPQLDLYTYDKAQQHKKKPLHLLPINEKLKALNSNLKVKAQKIIQQHDLNLKLSNDLLKILDEVNQGCEQMNDYVYETSNKILNDKKIAGVIGGDHSSPYGLIKTLSEQHKEYCVLHIDAHLDLREGYQGFKYSHASIMNNILKLPNPPQDIISVAIRDYCQEELQIVENKNLSLFSDEQIQSELLTGSSFKSIIQRVINKIKHPLYISFDIDGLEPRFCPNTGTPVPGGLNFTQALFLLNEVGQTNSVIGFDLCEVAPSKSNDDEWDGNVGSRILFNLYKTTLS